ncbi:Hypothetical_protein [Hexamita inflata]|uniref:Hypothetical_protein n=1 Tax=Hexamita inflata TaxID=28002 RepID=A0AA86TTQ2_9EUKA|nr:Hypothetical protein HINF_LOCUS15976 [Hexamita inflata]
MSDFVYDLNEVIDALLIDYHLEQVHICLRSEIPEDYAVSLYVLNTFDASFLADRQIPLFCSTINFILNNTQLQLNYNYIFKLLIIFYELQLVHNNYERILAESFKSIFKFKPVFQFEVVHKRGFAFYFRCLLELNVFDTELFESTKDIGFKTDLSFLKFEQMVYLIGKQDCEDNLDQLLKCQVSKAEQLKFMQKTQLLTENINVLNGTEIQQLKYGAYRLSKDSQFKIKWYLKLACKFADVENVDIVQLVKFFAKHHEKEDILDEISDTLILLLQRKKILEVYEICVQKGINFTKLYSQAQVKLNLVELIQNEEFINANTELFIQNSDLNKLVDNLFSEIQFGRFTELSNNEHIQNFLQMLSPGMKISNQTVFNKQFDDEKCFNKVVQRLKHVKQYLSEEMQRLIQQFLDEPISLLSMQQMPIFQAQLLFTEHNTYLLTQTTPHYDNVIQLLIYLQQNNQNQNIPKFVRTLQEKDNGFELALSSVNQLQTSIRFEQSPAHIIENAISYLSAKPAEFTLSMFEVKTISDSLDYITSYLFVSNLSQIQLRTAFLLFKLVYSNWLSEKLSYQVFEFFKSKMNRMDKTLLDKVQDISQTTFLKTYQEKMVKQSFIQSQLNEIRTKNEDESPFQYALQLNLFTDGKRMKLVAIHEDIKDKIQLWK